MRTRRSFIERARRAAYHRALPPLNAFLAQLASSSWFFTAMCAPFRSRGAVIGLVAGDSPNREDCGYPCTGDDKMKVAGAVLGGIGAGALALRRSQQSPIFGKPEPQGRGQRLPTGVLRRLPKRPTEVGP